MYNLDRSNWQGPDTGADGWVHGDGVPPPPGTNNYNATGPYGDESNGGTYLPTGAPSRHKSFSQQ